MRVKSTRYYASRPHEQYVKDGEDWYLNTAYVGPKKRQGSTSAKSDRLAKPGGINEAVKSMRDKGHRVGRRVPEPIFEGAEPEYEPIPGKKNMSRVPSGYSRGLSGPAGGPRTYSQEVFDSAPWEVHEMTGDEKRLSGLYHAATSRAHPSSYEYRKQVLRDVVDTLDGNFSVGTGPLKWRDNGDGTKFAQTLHVGMDGQILQGQLEMDANGEIGEPSTEFLSEISGGWQEVSSGDSVRSREVRPLSTVLDPLPKNFTNIEEWRRDKVWRDNARIIAAEQALSIENSRVYANSTGRQSGPVASKDELEVACAKKIMGELRREEKKPMTHEERVRDAERGIPLQEEQ